MKFLFFISVQIIFIVFLFYLRKNSSKHFSDFKIACYASIFLYFSILIMAIGTNLYLKHHLNSFDLNGDGIFTDHEKSAEQQLAMHKVVADTGRNLAPVLGIIYSIVYFVIFIIIFKIISKMKILIFTTKNKQISTT